VLSRTDASHNSERRVTFFASSTAPNRPTQPSSSRRLGSGNLLEWKRDMLIHVYTTACRAFQRWRNAEVTQDFTGGNRCERGVLRSRGALLLTEFPLSTEDQQRLNSRLKYRQLQDIEIVWAAALSVTLYIIIIGFPRFFNAMLSCQKTLRQHRRAGRSGKFWSLTAFQEKGLLVESKKPLASLTT